LDFYLEQEAITLVLQKTEQELTEITEKRSLFSLSSLLSHTT